MVKSAKTKTKTKKPTLSYAAQGILRHAYEQMLTRAARLSSFACATVLPGISEVVDRQNQLAIDDLITFAIYTRQAIENSGIQLKLRSTEMGVLYGAVQKPTPIMDVINKIIHHQYIDVWRRSSDLSRKSPLAGGDLQEWMRTYRQGIAPAVIVKSDRGQMIGFHVVTLVDAVLEKILEPLVEHCSDCGLYLEDMYNP